MLGAGLLLALPVRAERLLWATANSGAAPLAWPCWVVWLRLALLLERLQELWVQRLALQLLRSTAQRAA